MTASPGWPDLPYEAWKDTCDTLHMWTQVVGKVKLELSPFLNEWWEVAFRVTPRGITTGLIPWRDGAFEVSFDFHEHNLLIAVSDGGTKAMPLYPRSVADFYAEFMASLRALGIEVSINTLPSEVPDPIHCHEDTVHASYDADHVTRWWRIVLLTDTVLQRFRSGFVGKSSPIHFFWGSFDLAHTRFSGRPAPPVTGGPRFFQIAEDQENFTCGFWPGNPNRAGLPSEEAAYYAYVYPEPAGFREATVGPAGARYDTVLGEFILPHDTVRTSPAPEQAILDFVTGTYECAANLGGWDRDALEKAPPRGITRAERLRSRR